MISKEIKDLLIKFFSELISCENAVQINRQVLSESTDFDSHQIFNHLLSNNNSSDDNITVLDIKKYLNENGIEISEHEAKMIILFYDINADGKLSFDEFINLVRNERASINNKLFRIQDNNISFNINFSLCALLKKELAVSKIIMELLKELRNKIDFNLHNIYHHLKNGKLITSQGLKIFLAENNVPFIESDIKLLMRRLDLNKDGKIDF